MCKSGISGSCCSYSTRIAATTIYVVYTSFIVHFSVYLYCLFIFWPSLFIIAHIIRPLLSTQTHTQILSRDTLMVRNERLVLVNVHFCYFCLLSGSMFPRINILHQKQNKKEK